MTPGAAPPKRIGRYRIIRTLGAGGMGEVFLAEDERLGRRVALKRPKGAADQQPSALQRLQREARHIAQLSHPGIGAVHDLIDADGATYLVMEYVEGEDLSTLLARGPLPLDEALRIGGEIASALAAAHERNIIHRDLKPTNVRITPEGHAKVLDFGLSRVDHATRPGTQSTTAGSLVTQFGQFVGSPGYAAPEQVLGQPGDARTDIFSLGVLLYEVITGTLPFGGTDALSRLVATASETPRPARERHPDVPEALDALLLQLLAKEPAQRPVSAREVGDALDAIRRGVPIGDVRVAPPRAPQTTALPKTRAWTAVVGRHGLAAGLGTAAVLFAAAAMWFGLQPRGPAAVPALAPAATSAAALPVVAVLTPSNLTGNPANDTLAVGFADSLMTDLSSLRDVVVIAHADAQQEVARAKGDRQAVARNLGASYLVDSSIQQAGAELRVNARLLAASGQVVWARDFAGPADRVFDLQRQLAEGFVEGLELRVRQTERARLGTRTTRDVAALAEYWRGRSLLDANDLPSIQTAVKSFETAVEKDAGFAEAHAGLGEAAWRAYEISKDPSWTERAIAASEHALELEPALPRVWLTLAIVHDGTGKPELALEDLAKAEERLPNSDEVFRLRGVVLDRLGRTEEALDSYRRAIALRPGFWRNHQVLGLRLFRLGRLDAALEAFTRSTELRPDSSSGFQALGTTHQALGHLDEARANYERAIALAPSSAAYSNLGAILHWQGRYREAIVEYRKALALAPDRAARSHVLRRNIGDAHAKLGETLEARQSYGIAASLAEQELAINDRDARVRANLAVYRMKLGEVGVARQHLATALAMAPDEPDVVYAQAVVEALTGDAQAAWTALERALSLGARAVIAEHDDDLESVRRLPPYAASRRAAR